MWDITALGELLIDMAPVSVEDESHRVVSAYLPKPGGAPANCIAQLAKLGRKVAMIGCVGDDVFGQRILDALRDVDIDVSCIQVDTEIPTTLAFVSLNEEGDREFTFYRKPGADLRVKWNRQAEKLIKESYIFHLGTLSLVDEPSITTTMKALDCARESRKLISFDPNFRLNLWTSFYALREATAAILPYAHVVKISGDELRAFCHPSEVKEQVNPKGKREYFLPDVQPEEDKVRENIDQVFKDYPQLKLLAVTFGAKGSILAMKDRTVFTPAFSIRAVDTTGSGDAFMGALLSGLLESKVEGKFGVDGIPWDKLALEEMGGFANACGAYAALSYGAIPSLGEKDKVEDFIRGFQDK